MTYGLRIVNPSGELVLDSEAKGLHYIGKPTLITTVQTSGTTVVTAPGKKTGYSIYEIAYNGPVLIGHALPVGKSACVYDLTEVSSGVWRFKTHCTSTLDGQGFGIVEEPLENWAFGMPLTAPSGYGMVLYDAAGNVSWDLTKQGLLFPRFLADMDGGAQTIPSLVKPIILGCLASFLITEPPAGANRWNYLERRRCWKLDGSNVLRDIAFTTWNYQYAGASPAGLGEGGFYRSIAIVMNGQYLP